MCDFYINESQTLLTNDLEILSEQFLWDAKSMFRSLTLRAVVVRTGFEPVIVDMVSTVDYPPHLTTYPCVYQFRHLTMVVSLS